jgi:hypothetical protein
MCTQRLKDDQDLSFYFEQALKIEKFKRFHGFDKP